MEYGIKIENGKKYENHKLKENDFSIIKCIGEGAFSKVYLVRKQGSDKYFALKKMRKKYIVNHDSADKIMNERKLLSRLHHPYIIHLHYAFQNKTHLFLVFDFINGGDLFFHLENEPKYRFPEKQARFYAAQLFLALQYIHSEGVIYRDLKPENVLVGNDGHLKLADFGLCKIIGKKFRRARKLRLINRGLTNTVVGTPLYLSPEQLTGHIFLKKNVIKTIKGFGRMVDWWAYGVVLHEMLTGRHPFDSTGNLRFNIDRLLNDVSRKGFVVDENRVKKFLSRSAIDLLRKLLVRNPKRRIGYKDENEIKNHPFFKRIDWKAMEMKDKEVLIPPMIPIVKGPGDTSYFNHQEKKKKKKRRRRKDRILKKDQRRFIGYSFACDTWAEGEEEKEEICGCCGKDHDEEICEEKDFVVSNFKLFEEKQQEEENEGEVKTEIKKTEILLLSNEYFG